jgi:hypothetical protein
MFFVCRYIDHEYVNNQSDESLPPPMDDGSLPDVSANPGHNSPIGADGADDSLNGPNAIDTR